MRTLGVALLIVVTAAWGSSFLLVKDVVAHMPAMRFLAYRFWIGAAVLVLLRPRALFMLSRATLVRGVGLGLCLGGGYVCQTIGLQHTSAAISGFITGLCVVFTPLFAWPLLKQRASIRTLGAVLVATVGLGVMSLHGGSLGAGEALTLLCAVFYALQIVGLGAWSSTESAYVLTIVQLVTVAVCCSIGTIPQGFALPHGELEWFGVIATAVITTSLAFVIQAWAQSFISPTRAAIIFTLEPAFAGLVAVAGGERLAASVIIGGILVIASMVLAELSAREPKLGRAELRNRA